jgi:hypothetical protein
MPAARLSPKVGSARHALRREKQEIALKEEGAYMYSLAQIVTAAIDGWRTTIGRGQPPN